MLHVLRIWPQGEVTTELKEKLYEFHMRWQKEVGDMFRSIPELKMQNPSMSDMQIRQFLLYVSRYRILKHSVLERDCSSGAFRSSIYIALLVCSTSFVNPTFSDHAGLVSCFRVRYWISRTATERKSEEIASDYGWTRDSANQVFSVHLIIVSIGWFKNVRSGNAS